MNDLIISKKQLYKYMRKPIAPPGYVEQVTKGKGSKYNRKQKYKDIYSFDKD